MIRKETAHVRTLERQVTSLVAERDRYADALRAIGDLPGDCDDALSLAFAIIDAVLDGENRRTG